MLNREFSTEDVPTIGVALRWSEDMIMSGWVKRTSLMPIISHLRAGRAVNSIVISRERFIWGDTVCYWGKIEWVVDNDDSDTE